MPNPNCVVGVWTPPPNVRVRIAFGQLPNAMRAVLWVKVSKDGSVYLGPRKPGETTTKIGRSVAEDGRVTVKYKDGTPITDEGTLAQKKISFHASGAIHAAGQRSFRGTLRGISERQLLCHFLPQELSTFPVLKKIEKYDICLDYPVNPAYPVVCDVYVGPLTELYPPLEKVSVPYQLSVILQYNDLTDIGGFFVQLIFYHLVKRPWPPASYLLWPVTEDEGEVKP